MPGERSSHFAWQCALTVLLGAVLLFLVQPIISKIILPWFGGSPAVWTTCMLFFQTLLLAGYAYAHWLARAFNQSWQMRIHAFMTLAAALTLPIAPPQPSVEVDRDPVGAILWLLGMNVGLPFFVVSATGPLLQVWFAGGYPGRPPYRLYALSNVGSLSALWLFPLVLEPRLTSAQQDLLWSAGFGVYLVLLFILSLTYERMPADEDEIVYPKRATIKEPVAWREFALWMGLPALASALLLAVTSHICQDVPSVPFLWILPLSLYLVTFIIAFDSPRWYGRGVWGWLAALSLVAVAVVMLDWEVQKYVREKLAQLGVTAKFNLTEYTDRAEVEIGIFVTALFCVAMICHGETARRKPAPGRLTLFYLAISAGGALGSAVVALVCPRIFNGYYELSIALVLGFLLAGAVVIRSITDAFPKNVRRRYIVSSVSSLALAAGLALVTSAQIDYATPDADLQVRNFYGVASVKTEYSEDKEPVGRVLYNGQINHGYQFLRGHRRREPNSYYATGSGVDVAFEVLRARGEPLRVGVIGLGTGTLAAFGKEGDDFQFYEIDKKIEKIAREYFTYLEDSPATTHVRLGDARLFMQQQLEREGSQQFDLLVVDAFSGDAIPMHLLTLEAFHLYLEHIKPSGVLAIHVSNRHLDLAPVVTRLAEEIEAAAILVERDEFGNHSYEAASDWILVTGDPSIIRDPVVAGLGERLNGKFPNAPRWTDSFSNLLEVLD